MGKFSAFLTLALAASILCAGCVAEEPGPVYAGPSYGYDAGYYGYPYDYGYPWYTGADIDIGYGWGRSSYRHDWGHGGWHGGGFHGGGGFRGGGFHGGGHR